jgi:hypothetical protein
MEEKQITHQKWQEAITLEKTLMLVVKAIGV